MFDLLSYSDYFTESLKRSFTIDNFYDDEFADGSPGNFRYGTAALAITGCIFFMSAVCYLLIASIRTCIKGVGPKQNNEVSAEQPKAEVNAPE